MRNYFRIYLGKENCHADTCLREGFIGVDFDLAQDLAPVLKGSDRDSLEAIKHLLKQRYPGAPKIRIGHHSSTIHIVTKELRQGDIVFCPNGEGRYLVGEIIAPYAYAAGQILPHRRGVRWYSQTIERSAMSQSLQNSTGSIGTRCNISNYAEELENLISNAASPIIVSTDETIENPAAFALEKHLEDFLVHNWPQTLLGKSYDMYEDEECDGRQFRTDTGSIDILAISKDKKELLVVELKKGRASDVTVGQIQRYMGFVQEELAEEGQAVRGVIIAQEDDLSIRRALQVAPNIKFYRYQINFTLLAE